MRTLSISDQFFINADQMLRTLFARPRAAARPTPGENLALADPEHELSNAEQKKAAALMRINHCGEVCAQALYYGQALSARNEQTLNAFYHAADEENDHLAWCEARLESLSSHTSYLNPAYFVASFGIGVCAGLISDATSMSFVKETEEQVVAHLRDHLSRLPKNDIQSQAVIVQMIEDENKHATMALSHGAYELPIAIKGAMRLFSKVMTSTTYFI